MKKIYCLFFILSLTINFLFFLTLIKGIFIQQNANRNNIKLKKVFSDATFDLITENKKNAAEDFTVLARNNKNQESIFCVISVCSIRHDSYGGCRDSAEGGRFCHA